MRISDWSSDVCSSDLLPRQPNDSAARSSISRISASISRGLVPLIDQPHLAQPVLLALVGRPAHRGACGRRLAPAPVKKLLARSEEHTSELQSLMRISYAVFFLKKKKKTNLNTKTKELRPN